MEDTQTHDTGVIREKQADEVCDIYDIYGNRTGKTFVRGEPLSDGQYVMVVDVWIVNSKDEMLSENFVVEQDFDTADAVLQTEEVSQIKWVSVSQLKQMAGHREFYRYPEFFDVVRFLEERRRKRGNRYNLPQQNRKLEERK